VALRHGALEAHRGAIDARELPPSHWSIRVPLAEQAHGAPSLFSLEQGPRTQLACPPRTTHCSPPRGQSRTPTTFSCEQLMARPSSSHRPAGPFFPRSSQTSRAAPRIMQVRSLRARVRPEAALADGERELHRVGRGELVHHALNAAGHARRERRRREREVGARREERAHVLHVLDVRGSHEPLPRRDDVRGNPAVARPGRCCALAMPVRVATAVTPVKTASAPKMLPPSTVTIPAPTRDDRVCRASPRVRPCAFMSDKRGRSRGSPASTLLSETLLSELTKERRLTSRFIRARRARRHAGPGRPRTAATRGAGPDGLPLTRSHAAGRQGRTDRVRCAAL